MSLDSSFMRQLDTHPFKIAVREMLYKHMDPELAGRFVFEYEAEKYNLDNNKSIQNQRRDGNFIMEVWYKNAQGLVSEFVCDLYSWESASQCEARLLRGITDKVKVGKLGQDWMEGKGGVLKFNPEITLGKYETKSN